MSRHQSGIWSYEDDPPTHSERATVARLAWCIDTLMKLGCPPHPASRFPESLRYIRNVSHQPGLLDDAAVRSQVAEIQRSVWELMVILIAAVRLPRASSPFTAEKLREILGGSVAADDSHARDTQFELYVVALFVIGGFEVRRGEPDAQLHLFGEWVGIEAKRFTTLNPDTVRRALSRGAGQIGGHSESGIIRVVRSRGFLAVNIDALFHSIDADVDRIQLIERFNERLEILDRETRVLADKPAIFGLLACGHVAAWVRTTDDPHWRIDTKFALRWVGVHGDDRTDVALTRELLSHIDRLNAAALALRTKVPRKLAGAVEPAQ